MLKRFHPIVRKWFGATFGKPSDPQRQGWPAIATGANTLILAPTGTGKTLAAFLWELNELIVRGRQEPLPNGVLLLYISPLKALNNDIQRNLEVPLAELRARFEAADEPFPEIRIGVRTGDTPPSARARMLRKAPHILITTPESLNIMLTSLKGRGMFAGTRAVIVDEIHALAGSKRGVHMALTLERLEEMTEGRPQRIGLSATQRPLEEVARFLGGCSAPEAANSPAGFREVRIVDCGTTKKMDLSVKSPVADLGDVGGSVWLSVAPLVLDQIRSAKTTLVFVNNRAQAERIAARVNALAEEDIAQPYHGSIARERRLMLEERLKAGNLRALITTSSLELGIDIGSVDLVIQLQSPKRVAAALQRVGRAGHALGQASRGIFVPTFRDDAVEIAAMIPAMRAGDVEATQVVQNALDVLAQAIVAAVSVDDWTSDALFVLVRRAYPYHRLTRNVFDEVLGMLSGKYPSDVAAKLEPRITWDRTTDRLSGSRAARMTAVISGGTIPDRGLYSVNLPDRIRLGELDEEFVHESRIGDVFQLGSTTWRIAAIEHDRVIVHPAPGMPARMPFWHGEYAARSLAMSRRIGALRRELAAGTDEKRLADEYACDQQTIHSLVQYIGTQKAATGIVPDDLNVVIETFRDETAAVRMVVHAAFGGRVNAPWGMALAKRVREITGTDPQVQTTDDGIMLRLPDLGMMPPVSSLLGLSPAEAEQLIKEEVGGTSLFGARFRMNAARSLLLPRGNPRRRMPLWLQRLKALDLLQVVKEYPAFPILVETYREVLQEAFDLAGLKSVLGAIESGQIQVHHVETGRASPFAASLQFGFVMDWLYGDDTPRAEQRAALLSLDRTLLGEVMGEEASDDLTLEAMEEVLDERRGTATKRRARTADELAVLLDRAGDLTEDELRARTATASGRTGPDPLAELLESGRAIAVNFGLAADKQWRLILTENYGRYIAAFGADRMDTVRSGSMLVRNRADEVIPAILRAAAMTPPAARREIVARYLMQSGPVIASEIACRYGLDSRWVESRLAEWQRTGKLVQGNFRRDVAGPEWISRRIAELARHRALARLRKQIEAVDLHVFAAFLQSWQRLEPGKRGQGTAGVGSAIRQLYGLARPSSRWERDYLRARVTGYDAAWLTEFVATGDTVWMGEGTFDRESGALPLTRIRFFARGTGAMWIAKFPEVVLSENAEKVRTAIESEGASFMSDLQLLTGLGIFGLREALRELAASGIVTNDSAEAMREIIRWRPLLPTAGPDPTRWLPADFKPSAGRRVVQRRPNLRRLPKWKRPDVGGSGGASGWVGRWSLVNRAGTMGRRPDEDEHAEFIARRWLERYGFVSRDWWRRERPPVSWRSIYQQLKRLEFRGEVRRGYFIKGLAGAQFALPDAVEQLRMLASRDEATQDFIVLGVSDPANVYNLQLRGVELSPLSRPRGSGALLVTRAGRVAAAVEGRGKRVTIAEWVSDADEIAIRRSLAEFLRGEKNARSIGLPDVGSS